MLKVFTLITIIFALPLIIHNVNAELTIINDAFGLFSTTIANLGAASVQKLIVPLSHNVDLKLSCENSFLGPDPIFGILPGDSKF